MSSVQSGHRARQREAQPLSGLSTEVAHLGAAREDLSQRVGQPRSTHTPSRTSAALESDQPMKPLRKAELESLIADIAVDCREILLKASPKRPATEITSISSDIATGVFAGSVAMDTRDTESIRAQDG